MSTVLANPMLDRQTMLATLRSWSQRGWIRRLDNALAHFIAELCPIASAPVLLATALLAHLEGQGHTCLSLVELLTARSGMFGWEPEAASALDDVIAGLSPETSIWTQALCACSAVYLDGCAADDSRPLVLSGDTLYLRRYWAWEQRVATQVMLRSELEQEADPQLARPWLDRLFPLRDGAGPDWQKIACAVALRSRLCVVTGGPGTGKTFTAARLLALLWVTSVHPERLRIALAAPTGKAASRLTHSVALALLDLQASLGPALNLAELASQLGAARTLHSLLGARAGTRRLRPGRAGTLELDLLIVDEASMVHLEMMAALFEALPTSARIVLLGDKDQLASVEAGAVLGELCRDAEQGRYDDATLRFVEAATGQAIPGNLSDAQGPRWSQHVVMLRRSQRFGGAIGALAAAVNAGDAAAALAVLSIDASAPATWLPTSSPADVVELALQGREGAAGGLTAYLEAIRHRPSGGAAAEQEEWVRRVLRAFDEFRVLTPLRGGPWGVAALNHAIQDGLTQARRLTHQGEWYEGRPVLVTRNDHELGILNGDIGVVLKEDAGAAALRAFFVQGDAVRSVSVARLTDVETAFAMTVHKAQGSEFGHTVLVLPAEGNRSVTRELVYTGVTRARKALTIVCATRNSLYDALGRTSRRASGLALKSSTAAQHDPAAKPPDLPTGSMQGREP